MQTVCEQLLFDTIFYKWKREKLLNRKNEEDDNIQPNSKTVTTLVYMLELGQLYTAVITTVN